MRKREKKEKPKKPQKKATISNASCISSYLEINDFLGNGIIEVTYKKQRTKCIILRILGIDIFHYSDNDKEAIYRNFAAATMSVHIPCRYVFSDAHPILTEQIDFLNYKKERSSHTFSSVLLQQQIDIYKYKEKHQRDKLTYLMMFSDKASELEENAKNFIHRMSDTSVEIADKSQITEFLHNFMGTAHDTDVLPRSLELQQNCIVTDEQNYQTNLVIYDYPATLLNLEIAALISQIADATFVFDVEQRNKSTVLTELKYSLRELKARGVLNQDVADEEDTAIEFQKLLEIRNNIANGSEQMLYTTLRINVSGGDYESLCKKVKDIQLKLEEEGISAFVPINEMQNEYLSRLTFNNSIKNPFPLQDTYRTQYPFYYQQHIDRNSVYFGSSGTGGMVNINFFERTSARPSYDMLLCGIKGSGKSVTLKSLVQDYLMLGNKILVLDIESEYTNLANMFDGQIITLTKESRLNTLELHKVVDSNVEEDADPLSENAINFATEISRIITFFYQYIPEITDIEAEELKDVVIETFAEKGITDTTDVTVLSPEDFPVFSDVLACVRRRLYLNGTDGAFKDLTDRKIDILERLETYIKQLSEGMYAPMFNGASTISIRESNLIVFDVKALSEMDSRIYNAQLFNILSIMWAETCKNAAYNRRIRNSNDRRYVISVIDEAHRFVNANNVQVTDFVEKECRRTRKYDAALWLASQSISDFNPIGNSEGAQKVRVIFSLVQYKIVLKQSPESFDVLKETFKNFPESELMATKDFIPGEMLISFGSDRHRIHCQREVSKAHLMYSGNSRDTEAIIHGFFDQFYNEHDYSYYGRLLQDKESYDNFIEVFTAEVLQYYGYKRADSEVLYGLVHSATIKLAAELLLEAERAGDI